MITASGNNDIHIIKLWKVTFKLNVIFKILSLNINTHRITLLLFSSLSQNTQRISSSQATQPLATPVVSVTTPSLPPQGLVYSAMPTAYNTGKPTPLPFVGFISLFCAQHVLLWFLNSIFIEISYFQFLRFTFGYVKETHASLEKKLENTHWS